MASKLDKYQNILMNNINTQGMSFQSVCDQLHHDHEVTISRQALRSWYMRKIKKIAKRSIRLDASAVFKEIKPLIKSEITVTSLEKQIQLEEELLKKNSLSGLTSNSTYINNYRGGFVISKR
jgi:hypothetical protein